MKVVILCGASGSGKSTWASKHHPDAIVVSADHYFIGGDGVYRFDPSKLGAAFGACHRAFTEYIQTGTAPVVVVDNTNTTLVEIAPFVAVARAYGIEPEIRAWVGSPPEHALTRNTHGVPAETVTAMWDCLGATVANWPPFWPKPVMMKVEG